jgi:deazaflavin-dependent oxidoreductase (nitroreductase family)
MDPGRRTSRAVQRMSASKWFEVVGSRVVPPVDRLVYWVTRGRIVMSGSMVPSLILHAVGARTGRARDTPLATRPEPEGTWVVVGSNFGKPHHPAWTANLLAGPDVAITFGGRRIPVRAELLPASEKAAVWPQLIETWPVYDRYVEKSGRDLRVFRLRRRAVAAGP